VAFDHEARLELFAQEIWDTAKRILRATGAENTTDSVPICHVTLANGSEQDLYVHLVQHGNAVVFLEVSHSYVDQHFLRAQLWDTDRGKSGNYPIDQLFQHEAIAEKRPEGSKVAELFVKPTQLSIHTSRFDPSPYLLSEDELADLKQEVSKFPVFVSWKLFEQGEYQRAAAALKTIFSRPGVDPTESDAEDHFHLALFATCCYWAKDYASASRAFLSASNGFLKLGFHRTADVCLFFAIEAGKRISDKNAAFSIADDVAGDLPFLSVNQRAEVTKILRTYYSDVYIGTAVLCRRLVELHVSDLVVQRHGNTSSIKELVKNGKASGKIPKNTGPGLFAILVLALADGVLTPAEHEIATHIKDFGNNIHEEGGVENEVDSKYAIQACLHLLHRT
jgi:hypothetical protein